MKSRFCCALGLAAALALTSCREPAPEVRGGSRLQREASPYLREHADNTVEWYPWGEEAFERARRENKPVFLSIGYSTCHWCHVMETESFLDPEVGRLLSKHFVSVKVDRETRPDVDALYMEFVQQFTGQGGWPLTVFLTPNKEPFYGGTYFPNPSKYGKVSFPDLLRTVSQAWQDDREAILQQAQELSQRLGGLIPPSDLAPVSLLTKAVRDWKSRYDKVNAGFLPAPKFPSPPALDFLLRRAYLSQDKELRAMVVETLLAISRGGIRDHLEGGFHRYTVDAGWQVPHFEKMLYDQALLVSVYSRAYSWSSEPAFREAIETTLDYLENRLAAQNGGLYSAEDADSAIGGEKREGAYYTWTYTELEKVLSPQELDQCQKIYGTKPEGNAGQGELKGQNVLRLSPDFEPERHQSVKQKLRTARSTRHRPTRDEKILTEWNALAASAFAEAGRALGQERYTTRAKELLSFLESNLVVDGRLQRAYFEGEARVDAFAADYTALVAAYLALHQSTGEVAALERAVWWQEQLESLFADPADGGYFDSPANSELLHRQKVVSDGATYSANSAAALNLSLLHQLTGQEKYRDRLQSLLKFLSPRILASPTAHPGSLSALSAWYGSHTTVIVDSQNGEWWEVAISGYHPERGVLRVQNETDQARLAKVVRFLPPKQRANTAFRCQDQTCGPPITSFEGLKTSLLEE